MCKATNTLNEANLLRDIASKEINAGCYDFRIDGVAILSLVRDTIRTQYIKSFGFPVLVQRTGVKSFKFVLSVIKSIIHLLRLFIYGDKSQIVFYSFPRIEKIKGLYIEKFTDPIIEEINLKDYIIFDYGRGGEHKTPRIHQDRLIYLDSLSLIATLESFFLWRFFYKRHYHEFEGFFSSILSVYSLNIDKKSIIKEFYGRYKYASYLSLILKKTQARVVIGPSRDFMRPISVAARWNGIKVYELQHGITYSDTILYTGYRDRFVVPDLFLAFGDNNPKDVYGIEEDKIVNIGYALWNYVAKLTNNDTDRSNNVLVISDPGITEQLLDVIVSFSRKNQSIDFYFRPHPMEIVPTKCLNIINSISNLHLQDRTINIFEVLNSYNYVVGVDSTALYDALSFKKRVGKIRTNDLNPSYLNEEDKRMFWEIKNTDDFWEFMNSEEVKEVKSIYSPFDSQKFLKLLKL